MKKTFLLNLLVLLALLVLLVSDREVPVFAQQATATPRPTFGPTCTPTLSPPTPPAGATATPTPTLPVTAGSPALTSLALVFGAVFFLGSLGVVFLPLAKKLR